ncbi:MAG TPA: phosphotransferase [Thermoanaerobaculia bacterium]|nr:phosphotransferase [Thermoanaerobaculia bacterium]
MSVPAEAASWLDQWLGGGWSARPLAGDASVRAYFRVTAADGRTFMLAWYPEEVRPQLLRYLDATAAVAPHVPVPEVVQSCDAAVLQHDVGDRTLFAVLHEDREEGVRLYRGAIDLLAAFQKAPDRGLNAPFTREFFAGELEMAREYYVEQLMQRDGAPLKPVLEAIAGNVSRHPYVLCHRDFHGQNLHIDNDTIYLIDYQDLRMGPDMYDLASLLRDRGVARILGDGAEMELLQHYVDLTGADGDVRIRYFETLLQRSIKILGTFSKQPITRGRMHYLEFIPAALESVARCLDELPAYAVLRDIFPLQFDVRAARERAQKLNSEVADGKT